MQLGYVGIAAAGADTAFLARRYPFAAGLLAAFAVGACVIGLLPPGGEDTLADSVFPYAQLAPLAFLPAIAWISWNERGRRLRVLATLVWLLFLPLVLGDPAAGGILNRVADVAIGACVAAFALIARDAPAGRSGAWTSRATAG